jgi:uncharacterized protein DUF5655/bacteriocin resistance YdeI/OmpD-like protein/uncharacterized protein DUF4287
MSPTKSPSPPRKSPYSLHPSFAMEAAAIRNIEARTGRTFEQWVAITRREGPADEAARRQWLMERHGFTTNYAWWIAERAAGRGAAEQYDPEAYVEEQYSGKRAALRPIYERLLRIGLGLGEDVKACPCQTMVPLYRKHVFAEIKPAAQDRIELGLVLGDTKAAGRLGKARGRASSDRISHVIAIGSLDEIDAEVERWIRAAFERGTEKQERAPKGPVRMPADLARAIAASAKAKATFASLTERMKADWAEWIEQAARPETRAKRIGQTVEKLAAGKKRMY